MISNLVAMGSKITGAAKTTIMSCGTNKETPRSAAHIDDQPITSLSHSMIGLHHPTMADYGSLGSAQHGNLFHARPKSVQIVCRTSSSVHDVT